MAATEQRASARLADDASFDSRQFAALSLCHRLLVDLGDDAVGPRADKLWRPHCR
jgi:hypothetical protein